MLSVSEVQKHLKECLFSGLCKQLCDSMWYLYDDMMIMYPQLMTAAHKAESEQKDHPRDAVQVRPVTLEGKMALHIWESKWCSCKWQCMGHRELQPATLDSLEVSGKVIGINIIPGVKATIETIMRDITAMGSNVFNVRVGGIGFLGVWAHL